MINIGIIGDFHATGRTPTSRIDNYEDAMYKKLSFAVAKFNKIKVDAVILLGDLCNTPRISNKVAGTLSLILRQFEAPVYVIPGNHDLFGYSLSTVDNTTLGLLSKAGVFELATRDNPIRIDTGCEAVNIFFREYEAGIDGNIDTYIIDSSESNYGLDGVNVIASHSMLVEKPFFGDYVVINDALKVTNADVILTGHYHEGFINDKGNVKVYNPGSLMRHERCNRMPEIGKLTILGDKVDIVRIPVTVAETIDKVFDPSNVSIAQRKTNLNTFKSNLSGNTLASSAKIEDAIIDVCKNSGIGQNLRTEVLDRVSKARDFFDDTSPEIKGYVERPNVYITEIELKNFMSHKNTKIEVSDGMNVAIGESNQGKSAMFSHAVNFVFHNEPKGNEMIRIGAKSCSVTFYYSDGTAIRRSKSKTSSGTWEIYNGSEWQVFKGFSNNIPVEIMNQTQSPTVFLSKNTKACVNIANQHEGPFMISLSGAERASVIGNLTGVHYADHAIKTIVAENMKINSAIVNADSIIEESNLKLEGFKDIDKEKEQLDMLQFLIERVELISKDIRNAEMFSADLVMTSKKQIEPLKELERINSIGNIDDDIEVISKTLRDMEVFNKAKGIFVNIRDYIYRTGAKCRYFQDLTSHDSKIEKTENLILTLEKAIEFRSNRVKLYKSIIGYEAEIKKLDNSIIDNIEFEELNSEISKIELAIKYKEELDKMSNTIIISESKVEEYSNLISIGDKDYKELDEEFTEYLKGLEMCPICKTIIDNERIDVMKEN